MSYLERQAANDPIAKALEDLKLELDRSLVAVAGIENLGLDLPPGNNWRGPLVVEITRRWAMASDLADLIEITGVRAGHAAEGTRFEGVKP